MNFGIYLENLNSNVQFDIAFRLTSYAIKNNKFNDISIFYENIGPIPNQLECGMFNSTDIWNFEGKLLIFSLESAKKCFNIVNNFEMYYYAGLESINIIGLLEYMHRGMKVMAMTKKHKKEIYRLTGTFPIGTSNRADNLIRYIME